MMSSKPNDENAKHPADDQISPRFFIGIIVFCALIFVLGIATGKYAWSCECDNCECPSVIKGDAPEEKDTTIYLERATTYQATIEQCDSTPFSTASGAKINPDYYQKWCAISRDLHERFGGPLAFGDTLYVHSEEYPNFNGRWVVQDMMAPSYRKSIDFLLEEHKNHPKLGIGTDFNITFPKNNLYD